MRRDWSDAAFAVTLTLLGLLGAWWTVLIRRLVVENHALAVAVNGPSEAIEVAYTRKSFMLVGESLTLTVLAVALVGFAYRYSVRARRQQERLEQVLAASTHELKTPIAGVKALLETLSSGVLPLERAGPHLVAGLDGVARLEHLVEGVLAYQASVAHPEPLERAPLARFVDGVVAHRRATLPDEAVQVTLGEAGWAAVDASPDAMRVILENLLDNARKFGQGGPVRLAARQEAGWMFLDVRDQGPGFDEEQAASFFLPYRRGNAGRAGHGTGLGLYIARELAIGMGGDLTAHSEGEGRGACFTLRLPAGG